MAAHVTLVGSVDGEEGTKLVEPEHKPAASSEAATPIVDSPAPSPRGDALTNAPVDSPSSLSPGPTKAPTARRPLQEHERMAAIDRLKRRVVELEGQVAALQASEADLKERLAKRMFDEEHAKTARPQLVSLESWAAEDDDAPTVTALSMEASTELQAAAALMVQAHHRRRSARRGGVLLDAETAAEAAKRAKRKFRAAHAMSVMLRVMKSGHKKLKATAHGVLDTAMLTKKFANDLAGGLNPVNAARSFSLLIKESPAQALKLFKGLVTSPVTGPAFVRMLKLFADTATLLLDLLLRAALPVARLTVGMQLIKMLDPKAGVQVPVPACSRLAELLQRCGGGAGGDHKGYKPLREGDATDSSRSPAASEGSPPLLTVMVLPKGSAALGGEQLTRRPLALLSKLKVRLSQTPSFGGVISGGAAGVMAAGDAVGSATSTATRMVGKTAKKGLKKISGGGEKQEQSEASAGEGAPAAAEETSFDDTWPPEFAAIRSQVVKLTLNVKLRAALSLVDIAV